MRGDAAMRPQNGFMEVTQDEIEQARHSRPAALGYHDCRIRLVLHTQRIAKAGESGKLVPELLKMTSSALTKCVACHEAWQIKAGN